MKLSRASLSAQERYYFPVISSTKCSATRLLLDRALSLDCFLVWIEWITHKDEKYRRLALSALREMTKYGISTLSHCAVEANHAILGRKSVLRKLVDALMIPSEESTLSFILLSLFRLVCSSGKLSLINLTLLDKKKETIAKYRVLTPIKSILLDPKIKNSDARYWALNLAQQLCLCG